MGKIIVGIFLLGATAVSQAGPIDIGDGPVAGPIERGQSDFSDDVGYCPPGLPIEIPQLPDFLTSEGEQAFLKAMESIYLELEMASAEGKELLRKKKLSMKVLPLDSEDFFSGKIASYDSQGMISFRQGKILDAYHELKKRIPEEHITYYLALLSAGTFGHEIQHAVNHVLLGHLLIIQEEEFSAYVAKNLLAAELAAQYPELFDLYEEIFEEDERSIVSLGDFIQRGPEAVRELVLENYDTPPLDEKSSEESLSQMRKKLDFFEELNRECLNGFKSKICKDYLDNRLKGVDLKIILTLADDPQPWRFFLEEAGQEADYMLRDYLFFSDPSKVEMARNYYDNEQVYADVAWEKLKSLRDECDDEIISAPSSILDRVTR